jgi:flagellar biosynthesis protein FlhF
MKMRQFEGPDMRSALAKARRELGPDAVIVSTQEIPPLTKLGLGRSKVRVTAAIDDSPTGLVSPLRRAPAATGVGRLDKDLAALSLRNQIDSRTAVQRDAVRSVISANSADARALMADIKVLPPPWRNGGPRSVVLVGATGVGKTVTAAKIAAQARYHHGCTAGLLCADAVRIGSVEQLSSYARILQLPFAYANDDRSIDAALKQLRGCSLVVVDTAATNPRDEIELEANARLVRAVQSRLGALPCVSTSQPG